jgi:polyisoprenyl-phosphate glycosyltransferase
MKKVSVVIPVYQNEESLPLLFSKLQRVQEKLLQQQLAMEIIFVDDGSNDDSLQVLLKLRQTLEEIRVVKLTRNFGATHASKTGFQFVTGDCFMNLAADLQDPPDLINEMVDKWLGGAKFVMCVRRSRNDPLMSKGFARLYYWLVRFFVIEDYPRSGFDLALMDRALLPYLQGSSKNINPPLFAYWLGFKPEVIFYARQKRVYGKSRWTLSKRAKLFLDSILGFSVAPIRMILLVGALVSFASFSYGCWIVASALLWKFSVQGFPTIVALISFLLGLIIVMLGVIGEYIWRIFDEINKRPEAVIDEIY